ncbi:MAG: hypothetical protein SPJ27_05530, partial [Candidatus Onthovivens sp.]|nr:hypothetical protein [Candidatus Onthovivens sp.]
YKCITIKEIEATLEVNVYACKTSGYINFKVKENINKTRLVGNNIVYLKIKNALLVFNGY